MLRWIACVLVVVATAGCSNDCEELCRDVTDCQSYCDPGVEDCSDKDAIETAREADFEDCVSECEDAADDQGERCEEAISGYTDCVVDHSCGGSSRYCTGEGIRYFDECFAETSGATSCRFLCDQLESGCYPIELFGYPGPDCEDVCVEAAKKGSCSEALYDLQECAREHADPVAPCLQTDSTCLPQAETFGERCDGFGPTTPDPDLEAFCTSAAITICLCEDAEPTCEPRTLDQCFLQLSNGEACRTAWEDYLLCLENLDLCTSSIFDCDPQFQARRIACR